MNRAHSHARANERRVLLLAASVTGVFLVAEVAGGIFGNSLALIVDAGHLFGDLIAIGVALAAFWIAGRASGPQRTYGYARAEIMGTLLNGLALVLVAGYAGYEGARRIFATEEVRGSLVLWVGLAGLAGNLISAVIVHRASKANLNVRGVFLHLIGDAVGSVGVVASALIIMFTGWSLIDPIAGIFIGFLVLAAAVRLLRTTVDVLMETAPENVNLPDVHDAMVRQSGVRSAHDIHVWTLTSGCVAMSAHVTPMPGAPHTELLINLRERLKRQFGITHLTLQIEDEDVPDEDVHLEGDPRCLA
jgi:cobalt-zinc-cadmium efflux system protein